MKNETTKHLADGVSALVISTGIASSIMGFLNHNAAGLGVLVSLLGVVVASIFYYLNFKKSTLADDNKKELERLRSQMSALSNKGNK